MNVGSHEASGFPLVRIPFQEQPEVGIYYLREGLL